MVYYTSCNVPGAGEGTIQAQCEVPFGMVTMDVAWASIASNLVSLIRPLMVMLATQAIWSIWWWRRYANSPVKQLHGNSWVVGTAMTHMPGIITATSSLWKMYKYKVPSLSLILWVFATGVALPLLGFTSGVYIQGETEVSYHYRWSKKIESNITASIKNRNALVTSFGEVSYSEKPFLSGDIFKEHSKRMSNAAIFPPKPVPAWWYTEIVPKLGSCNIAKGVVHSVRPKTNFTVSFGEDNAERVSETLTGECTILRSSIDFFFDDKFISNNSPLKLDSVIGIKEANLTGQRCSLSYTCGIEIRVTEGNIYTNTTNEIGWLIDSSSNTFNNLNEFVNHWQESIGIDDEKMRSWLNEQEWKYKIINILKQAASAKYLAYRSLGRNRSPSTILAETFNELLREAATKNFGEVELKIEGVVRKLMVSWVMGLCWLITMLLSGITIGISIFKSRHHKPVKDMLDSWELIDKTAITYQSPSQGESELALYRWPTIYNKE
ncbi:hypothetical protein K493DRAFT_303588 [Basidiobolus meristosporus CBS 931.73]|uniref:Uncharacterized protein n=1 Tax=Basidiobolus meristosporus CBS 931.73 TaxID=1314790 RepID=A0A1Y1Y271_9FUNG|nr:hypothetical protein K493DRAFT_303588 [Basidiobolus meristosporus CBS 931.73]|eukprot:ORX92078.1 hypothetical protein K493DRAFT_303588 [Basidiobolus meristosporus CBS 931.73]